MIKGDTRTRSLDYSSHGSPNLHPRPQTLKPHILNLTEAIEFSIIGFTDGSTQGSSLGCAVPDEDC